MIIINQFVINIYIKVTDFKAASLQDLMNVK